VHHGSRAWTRFGFDRLHVTIFHEAAVRDVVDPHVGTGGGHHMRLRDFDNQIRLPDVPHIVIGKRAGRRHVGHVALLCALVDPGGNRRDLLLGERRIVLELLKADVALHVPGRHQPRRRLGLDRARVGARVFVGYERHRRVRVGAMAILAGALQNRRDVLCEGDRRRRSLLLARRSALREGGRV
jgi:hypothetical protein